MTSTFHTVTPASRRVCAVFCALLWGKRRLLTTEEIRMIPGRAGCLDTQRPDGAHADPSYTLEMEEHLNGGKLFGRSSLEKQRRDKIDTSESLPQSPRRFLARWTFDLMYFAPVGASEAVQTQTGRGGRRARTRSVRARRAGRRNAKHVRCCSSSCLHCRQPVTSASRLYKRPQGRK